MGRSRRPARRCRLVYHAFDLLWLDGKDLRDDTLVDRRRRLAAQIAGQSKPCLRYSEHFEGNGAAFFAAAVKHRLEGIVSKRSTSRYRSGPSKMWLKTRNMVEGLLGIEVDRDGKLLAHLARACGGIELHRNCASALSGIERADWPTPRPSPRSTWALLAGKRRYGSSRYQLECATFKEADF